MEKETYEVLSKMVERINAQKQLVEQLSKTVSELSATMTGIQDRLSKSELLLNDTLLKVKALSVPAVQQEAVAVAAAEEAPKPKRTRRKKVEAPAVGEEAPVVEVTTVRSVATVSGAKWEGREFPVFVNDVEITPTVITRCKIAEENGSGVPDGLPHDVYDYVVRQSQDGLCGILQSYASAQEAQSEEPNVMVD